MTVLLSLPKQIGGGQIEDVKTSSSFQRGDLVRKNIIFLDGISGCDTTSAPYNKGKLKIMQILENNQQIAEWVQLIQQRNADTDVASTEESFFIWLYGGKKTDTLIDDVRHECYLKDLRKSKSNVIAFSHSGCFERDYISPGRTTKFKLGLGTITGSESWVKGRAGRSNIWRAYAKPLLDQSIKWWPKKGSFEPSKGEVRTSY